MATSYTYFNPKIQNDQLYGRSGDQYYGELIRLGGDLSSAGLPSSNSANTSRILFPCSPETIELRRDNNFEVTPSPIHPDGVWTYQGTSSLEIPVEFTLHAFDEYTNRYGSSAIMDLAARLHSFATPVQASITSNTDAASGKNSNPNANSSGEQRTNEASKTTSADSTTSTSPIVAWPPACRLMLTSVGAYGVESTGFIKSVSVKLMGPFLSANVSANNSQSGTSSTHSQYYNMPSAATYSFTFVCSSGYYNLSLGGDNNEDKRNKAISNSWIKAQRYSGDIRTSLYNDLSKSNSAVYY